MNSGVLGVPLCFNTLNKKLNLQRLPCSVQGLRSRKNIIGKTMQNLSGVASRLGNLKFISKRI